MCISIGRKIVAIHGKTASLNDGRIVRIGLVPDVAVGDSIEVYGDLALGKISGARQGVRQIKTIERGGIK